MEEKNIVVFDVETTGLSLLDHIIQLSAIKIDRKFNILDKFNEYVIPNGQWNISEGVSKVNGLTKDFILEHGKSIKDIADEFLKFIDNCDICGYNSNKFDVIHLYNDFHEIGYDIDFERRWYDVYGIETHLHPNKLKDVYIRYTGHTMEDDGLKQHDSLSDVFATIKILKMQMIHNNLTFDELNSWNENNLYSPEGSIRRIITEDNSDRFVFTNGKYKDQDIYDIYMKDISYISWWANKVATSYSKSVIKKYISCKLN